MPCPGTALLQGVALCNNLNFSGSFDIYSLKNILQKMLTFEKKFLLYVGRLESVGNAVNIMYTEPGESERSPRPRIVRLLSPPANYTTRGCRS